MSDIIVCYKNKTPANNWSGLIETLRTYKSSVFEFGPFVNRVEKLMKA